jgi:hypothetical protein
VIAAVVLLAIGSRHDVAAPAAAEPASPAAAALAPAGPASAARPGPVGANCSLKDPTGGRCVTATTEHGLDELIRVFGPLRKGPTLASAGCWDAHKWNPSSDHPKGRGCDLVPGKLGEFAKGDVLDRGWAVANWLRANAGVLHVRYVIWQGRIWQADRPSDADGWGHPYSGGGVYDPANVTGGHWDHVHVSFQP